MRFFLLRRTSYALTLAGCLAAGVFGWATEPPSPQTAQDNHESEKVARPAHFLVLRLSGAMLNALIDRPIDVQAAVQDVVLGTPVTGAARVTGRPRVVLQPSFDQARFTMTVSGTVYSRTTGHNDRATIYGRSITSFTASAPIIFEPGKGFYSHAPQIATSTRVYTDRIVPKRGGMIGRIIQRRAWDEVASQRETLTAIARQRATSRITAAFTRHLDERLANLNETIAFRATIANLRDQAEGTPQVVCCTTAEYVEIADTLGAERSTIVLPVLSSASAAGAPLELWVHNRILPGGLADGLKTLLASPDQNAVVSALALMPGTFGKDAAAALTSFITQHQIGVQTLGEWTVIEVNSRPTVNALARTISR